MEKYLINPNQRIATINKDIYGHFSEHLGRCIYDGIFVGKDSKIPNANGMRTDVVTAERHGHSCAALARRLLCRRVPLDGRYRRTEGS